MSDLIERQAAIDALAKHEKSNGHNYTLFIDIVSECAEIIRDLPSAQPDRKKGKWRHYEGYLICSECGTEYDDDIMTHCGDDVPKFCPSCGADMRGERRENDTEMD